MVMKANNAIVNWSNDIVFDGSQTRYVFHKTKLVRLQKANYAVVFSLVSTIRATKLKPKLIYLFIYFTTILLQGEA